MKGDCGPAAIVVTVEAFWEMVVDPGGSVASNLLDGWNVVSGVAKTRNSREIPWMILVTT